MHQMMADAYFISVRVLRNHGEAPPKRCCIFCLTLARSMVSADLSDVTEFDLYCPHAKSRARHLRLRCFYPSVKQHAGRRRRPEADRACCATEGGRRELTLLDGAGAHVIRCATCLVLCRRRGVLVDANVRPVVAGVRGAVVHDDANELVQLGARPWRARARALTPCCVYGARSICLGKAHSEASFASWPVGASKLSRFR